MLGLALMPAGVSDTEQFNLPMLAYMPPVEALLRFLLWLALAVTIPVAAVIVANLLTGRDPVYCCAGRWQNGCVRPPGFAKVSPERNGSFRPWRLRT